jgi:hypothetical protein
MRPTLDAPARDAGGEEPLQGDTRPTDATPSSGEQASVEGHAAPASASLSARPRAPDPAAQESGHGDLVAGSPSQELARPPGPPFPVARSRDAEKPAPVARIARTRYGGTFFLLNALLALEIYGDFAHPFSRAVDGSPWRLLARVARALLGADHDPADPLWPLLDELAGPTDDALAEWPAEWRVAADWLAPFPETGWTWSVASGRMRVVHPAAFAVVDLPLEADAGAQLARELAPYGATATHGAGAGVSAGIWPECLADFLRARIHRALQTPTPDASVRLLLELPGRVCIDDARVDVHMSLAELPIEIRLAGLDRDPGWIPAAGRFLAFHFEL